jgi:hypothetical protein
MERCGVDLPHVTIVHTEDAHLFRDLPFSRELKVMTTEEVLGRAMDRRRQVWGISRRDYRYWITGKGVHGWMAQQLTKLAVAELMETESYVCVDADLFFTAPLAAGDFHAADGRLHLYETEFDVDVEMAEWYAHSLRFFGIKETGVPVRQFTHAPAPLHRGVVRDMCRDIERRHGMPWMEAIVRGDRLMEYTLYATYARHIDGLQRVAAVQPEICQYVWWKKDAATLADDLARPAPRRKMVLINSNIGLDVEGYRPIALQLWAAGQKVGAA